MAYYLIAIDDTDNLESRGTGFRARGLAADLIASGLAEVNGITRHQLFVDARIPYTSHNSSLCLGAEISPARLPDIVAFCRDFLLRESAEGSDAGLCLGAAEQFTEEAVAFGRSAKSEVLTKDMATALARRLGVHLAGLTGDGGGVIGALAGAALRKEGRDGRFVWMPGLRELSGVLTLEELKLRTPIDRVESLCGHHVASAERINVDPWPRPVMIDGCAVMLVAAPETEEERVSNGYDWKLAPRDIVRRY